MDPPPLNPDLQPSTELLRPVVLFGLRPLHLQNKLFQNPSPGLNYSNWPYTRELIEPNEVPQH